MNIPMLKNLTNNELINFCQFSKPVSALTNKELLIKELSERLKVSGEVIDRLDKELDELNEHI